MQVPSDQKEKFRQRRTGINRWNCSTYNRNFNYISA